MIYKGKYNVVPAPLLVRDWEHKTVVLKKRLANGYCIMPEGTVMYVSVSGPVITLSQFLDKCPACGINRTFVRIASGKEYKLSVFNFIEIIETLEFSDYVNNDMDTKEYNIIEPPKLIKDWKNKSVIAKKDIRISSFNSVPENTILRVYSTSGKAVFAMTDPCPLCGTQKIVELKETREKKLEYIDFIDLEYLDHNISSIK